MLIGNVFSELMFGLIKKCYNKVVEYMNIFWIYVYKCMLYLYVLCFCNKIFIIIVVIEFSW